MINAVTPEAVHTHIIPLPNCLSRVNSVINIAKKRIDIKNKDRPYFIDMVCLFDVYK